MPVPGGPEQYALRNAAADRGVPARFPQEVDDFLDFVFRFVHPCDVLKRHEIVASLGDAGPRGDRGDSAGGGAIDREAQKREEGGRREHGGPAQGRWVVRRHDVHADVSPDQVRDERGVGRQEFGGRDCLKDLARFQLDANRALAEPDLGHPSSFDLAHEVRKGHDRRFGGPANEVVSDSQGRKQGTGDDREEKSRPAKVR